jgi:hypothetical protein
MEVPDGRNVVSDRIFSSPANITITVPDGQRIGPRWRAPRSD